MLRDFGPEQAGSDAEFFTRVSFFDFLEAPARKAILRQRLAYLQRGLEYLNSLQQIAEEREEDEGLASAIRVYVVKFYRTQFAEARGSAPRSGKRE